MKTMKTLLLIFVGIMFFGCTKDDGLSNTCKTCTTTIKTTYHQDKTEVQNLCHGEWQAVDGKKTTVKTMEGIYYVYITSTTVCK
jgi:hypothetical protein